MDFSLPVFSIHGIFQARVLEWVAISFSRGFSQPRDWTQVSRIIGRCFYHLSHEGRSAYLRLLIFLLAILIPACSSSSPAFLMMCSVYKLNKQGDSIQPWRTPFPICNQSVVPCPVLTVASWPAHRFLKKWVYMLIIPPELDHKPIWRELGLITSHLNYSF